MSLKTVHTVLINVPCSLTSLSYGQNGGQGKWLKCNGAFSPESASHKFFEGLVDLFLSFFHSDTTEQKKGGVIGFEFS